MHTLCEPLVFTVFLSVLALLHIRFHLVIQLRMQPAGAHRDVDQLPRFRFDGDNRLEFLSGWPDICAHFGFRALLLDNPVLARPRLAADHANMEEVLEWDRLNELAKSKLKFYLTPDVYKVVWSGDQMTAKEFYDRLHAMFLRGDMRSAQVLEQALANCTKRSNETFLAWWARLESLFTEFAMLGRAKDDADKKAKAMFLCGDEYRALAELLGGPDDVDYITFKTAMLKRDRDQRIFGVARDQVLANALTINQQQRMVAAPAPTIVGDGAFAVSQRQAWRGTGFRSNNARGRGRRAGRGGRVAASQNQHNFMQHLSQARGMGRAMRGGYDDQRQAQHGGAGGFQGSCFTCGEYGHRQRRCPNRRERSNLVVAPADNADHLYNFLTSIRIHDFSAVVCDFSIRG